MTLPDQIRRLVRSNRADRFFITGLPGDIENPGMFETRAEAEAWLAGQADLIIELLRQRQRQIRPCMCCQAKFESAGPHNRLCDLCRRRSALDGDVQGFSFGAMTGRRKSA